MLAREAMKDHDALSGLLADYQDRIAQHEAQLKAAQAHLAHLQRNQRELRVRLDRRRNTSYAQLSLLASLPSVSQLEVLTTLMQLWERFGTPADTLQDISAGIEALLKLPKGTPILTLNHVQYGRWVGGELRTPPQLRWTEEFNWRVMLKGSVTVTVPVVALGDSPFAPRGQQLFIGSEAIVAHVRGVRRQLSDVAHKELQSAVEEAGLAWPHD